MTSTVVLPGTGGSQALRLAPQLIFGADALLLVYFFSGVTNVNWTSPFSTALVFACLLAAVVTGISFVFFRFTGDRLKQYKDDTGVVPLRGLDEVTNVSMGLALAAMIVLAALMFIRMGAEVLNALGPNAGGTAIVISLALALVSILANALVIAVYALDGSAEADRLGALGRAIYEPLARQHDLLERAEALDLPIAAIGPQAGTVVVEGIAAAGNELADAGRVIDTSEPAVKSNDEVGAIGYRRAGDKPRVDDHGSRRTSRSDRRLGSGRLAGAVALAVAAVIAIIVAVTATTFGLRFSGVSSLGTPSVSSLGTRMVIAATATANEPTPALPTDILQMLRSASASSTAATAYIVPPSDRQPTILPLTLRADGQVENGPRRSDAVDADISAVERALENEAATGQLDLLGTMATAVRAASPPATLIVVSSGLSTAGGFDLRQVGWGADPSSVAAQLKANELLPDLADWRVVFVGLGDVAGRQPALPLPQQTTLTSYWMAICQAAGAASCSVDNTARPQLASHITNPVPVVPVPTVTSVTAPMHQTVTTLPDTLLFQLDSSVLVPSAATVLQPVAQRARSQHQLVSITGYASPDGGTSAYNLALSAQRADAVRNQLIALGLPAGQITQVTGAGTAGQRPDACLVHGQLDEAVCAQLRRVVVVLSPAKASS